MDWVLERTCLDASDARSGHATCGRERTAYRRAGAAQGSVEPARIGREHREAAWFVFPSDGATFRLDGSRASSAQALRVLVGARGGEGSLSVRDGALRVEVEAGRASSIPLSAGVHTLELVLGGRVVDRRTVFVAPVGGAQER